MECPPNHACAQAASAAWLLYWHAGQGQAAAGTNWVQAADTWNTADISCAVATASTPCGTARGCPGQAPRPRRLTWRQRQLCSQAGVGGQQAGQGVAGAGSSRGWRWRLVSIRSEQDGRVVYVGTRCVAIITCRLIPFPSQPGHRLQNLSMPIPNGPGCAAGTDWSVCHYCRRHQDPGACASSALACYTHRGMRESHMQAWAGGSLTGHRQSQVLRLLAGPRLPGTGTHQCGLPVACPGGWWCG